MCFWDFADAFVGGVIGLLFAYICYRQHYPPFLHVDCHLPYASLAASAHAPLHPPDDPHPTDNATSLPLEGLTEGPVWLAASTETPPTPSPNHQAHLPILSDWLSDATTSWPLLDSCFHACLLLFLSFWFYWILSILTDSCKTKKVAFFCWILFFNEPWKSC